MAVCAASARVCGALPSLALNSKIRKTTISRVSLTCGSGLPRLSVGSNTWEAQTQLARGKARTVCGLADTSLVVSLSTGALLFLGRFVFLPFQRTQVAKAGLPQQNGVTHFEAGDSRAQEAVSFLKTKDPAGFTIVDLLAWGAIGHAVAFFILATANNGYDPTF